MIDSASPLSVVPSRLICAQECRYSSALQNFCLFACSLAGHSAWPRE